jgi:tetratricopeptide (TPR) repeat protein
LSRQNNLRVLISLAALTGAQWSATAQATGPHNAYNGDPLFAERLRECHGLVTLRHLDRARPLLTSLLIHYPQSADFWMLLGACDIETNDNIVVAHVQARKNLEKAIALDPQLGEAYYYMADLENFAGNWPAAIAAANKATTVAKPDRTAYRLAAAAYNAQGRPKEALEAIEKYILAYPKNRDGQPIKAAVLEGMGNYSDADKVYKEMIAKKLNDKYVFADVKCLVKLGRTDEAITAISRLIAANPQDEVAYRERAKLYSRAGKFDEAIKDLNLSIDEIPTSATYRERAELYKKTNRLDLYKKDMERADSM